MVRGLKPEGAAPLPELYTGPSGPSKKKFDRKSAPPSRGMSILKTPWNYNKTTSRWEEGSETTETYIGRVVEVFNRDYRAMSDVYTYATFALVLTEEGDLREVMVNANFECDMSGGRATVDATPEVLAQVAAIREATRLAAEKAAEEREAARIVRGRRVRVVRGRKIPIGTEGEVSWYGQTRYGARVGIRDLQGNVQFTAATNVVVVRG